MTFMHLIASNSSGTYTGTRAIMLKEPNKQRKVKKKQLVHSEKKPTYNNTGSESASESTARDTNGSHCSSNRRHKKTTG